MASFELIKKEGKIKFEGQVFNIDKLKIQLQKVNAGLFVARTCPGEIKYVLSEPAIQLMRSLNSRYNP